MTNGQTSGPTVSLDALFIAFLKVVLCGLGSGVVWARRITVEQRRWISEEEFADILSLCQFMPGPNVIGIAICVGAKVRGLAGAVSAGCGFLLGVLYLEHAHLAVLQKVFGGVSSAAAGLMSAAPIR
jgi:chromate transporter